MNHVMRAIFFSIIIGVLGCAGGSDIPFSQQAESRGFGDRLRGSKTAPATVPERTPEWIAALRTPTLEVTREQTGQVAILSPFSDRRDAKSGAVRIWRAADDSQIVLREGVLIATRGLGHDIESTMSQTILAALSSPTPVQGAHRLYLVSGEMGTDVVNLKCQSVVIGADVVEIGSSRIATHHVRANCDWRSVKKVYDFWVGVKDKTIWQSRQWAGPGLGYVRMRLLKD